MQSIISYWYTFSDECFRVPQNLLLAIALDKCVLICQDFRLDALRSLP